MNSKRSVHIKSQSNKGVKPKGDVKESGDLMKEYVKFLGKIVGKKEKFTVKREKFL